MISDFDIICFSTAEWDTPLPTNKHHLMTRLADSNRVLYIETLGTRRPRLNLSDWRRIKQRLRRGSRPLQQPRPNLRVVSPLTLPSFRGPFAIGANRFLFSAKLRRIVEDLDFKKPIIWVYNPYAVYFLEDISKQIVVFHCVDDLAEVPGANQAAMRKAVSRLAAEADLIFTTTPELQKQLQGLNPETHLQPNVADFDHFHSAVSDSTTVAPPIRQLPKPVIAFAGNLTAHKVDFDLLMTLAQIRPQWSFALIGPFWEGKTGAPLQSLRQCRNIHLIGHVPYEELPRYMKGADVLIIPYRINPATSSVFPLKLHEYFATGRPVVSTPLPALKNLTLRIPLAETPEQFAEAIEQALTQDTPKARNERFEVARRNTWKTRLEEMSSHIERILEKKGRI